MNENSNINCLDIQERVRLNDKKVIEVIKKQKLENVLELQYMNRVDRNNIIRKLKNIDGINYRQLERITGIGRGAIEKA